MNGLTLPRSDKLSPQDAFPWSGVFCGYEIRQNSKVLSNLSNKVTLEISVDGEISFVTRETGLSDAMESLLSSNSESYQLYGPGNMEAPILCVQKQTQSSSADVISRFVPQRTPVYAGNFTKAARFVGFIKCAPERLLSLPLCLSADECTIHLKAPQKMHGEEQVDNKDILSLVNGTFEIIPTKHAKTNRDWLEKQLAVLHTFLILVSGRMIGLGWLAALDTSGKTIGNLLGFMRADGYIQDSPTWSSFHAKNQVETLFQKFNVISAEKAQLLKSSLSFYRASTVARTSSIETAIVMGQVTLETLVEGILVAEAGWSKNLVNDARGFHNKLRACMAFVGYSGDPYQHVAEFREWSKEEKSSDTFEGLTKLRNQIVHPKKGTTTKGIVLVQAWNVQLFLAELLFFHLLSFRGDFCDRRAMGRWFGETEAIPLKPA